MMNKNDITAFAKNILHSHKGIKSPQIMHPAREWLVGLSIAIGIFSVCAYFSVQTYLEYRDVDLTTEVDDSAVTTVYRASLVEAALEMFNAREQEYDSLRSGLVPVVVPQEDVDIVIEDDIPAPVPTSTPEENTEEVVIEEEVATTSEEDIENLDAQLFQ